MTAPLTLWVLAITVGVFLFTGWLHLPRPPSLDGQRWFKALLATVLLGEVERAGEDGLRWTDRVNRLLCFHPAGRWPEIKLDPSRDAEVPDGGFLPGERALVESLRGRDVRARFQWLYVDEPMGAVARVVDPATLGSDYAPQTWLGRGWDWSSVADWDQLPGRLRALDVKWLFLYDPVDAGPPLLQALCEQVGSGAFYLELSDAPLDELTEAFLASVLDIHEQEANAAQRYVLVGQSRSIAIILRALLKHPGLRDHVDAVLSVGGWIGGRPGHDGALSPERMADWLEAHFNHRSLDTESAGKTPYFSLQWIRPAECPLGADGQPIALARFPTVRASSDEVYGIESVDLGLLNSEQELPLDTVSRALWAVVSLWLLSRR